jgi:hypothetical protein
MRGCQRLARPSAGFTVIEVAIAAFVLLVVSGALVTALDGLRGAALTGDVSARLSEAGEKALLAIVEDLRRSGRVNTGTAYPYTFEGGDSPFDDMHDHAPAAENGAAGDADFGPDREIVLLLPCDEDTLGPPAVAGVPDSIPDLDADGELIWGDEEISYVLVTWADGINRLERRVDGAGPGRVLASWVERVRFDDFNSDAAIPNSASVRVRLWMRQPDDRGTVHRWFGEARVRMRNGG